MLFDFLLPQIHFFTFTGLGLPGPAWPVAVRAALGHSALKGRRRVVNVPPVTFAAHVAAVTGHRLQVEAGAQVLCGNRIGNDTAVALIKNAVTRHIGRLLPEAAQAR